MSPQVANLSDRDMQDVAASYAFLPRLTAAPSNAALDIVASGAPMRKIPPCAACDGGFDVADCAALSVMLPRRIIVGFSGSADAGPGSGDMSASVPWISSPRSFSGVAPRKPAHSRGPFASFSFIILAARVYPPSAASMKWTCQSLSAESTKHVISAVSATCRPNTRTPAASSSVR